MKKNFILLLLILLFQSCKKFEEYDFQNEKCKSNPSATINAKLNGSLRYDFTISNNNAANEIIRTIWKIEGKAFSGNKVSYQFDKKGSQTIEVTFFNRCLMQGKTSTQIAVQ